jgi:hypothetical protein
LSLLTPDVARRERLARAVDQLSDRFGADSVRPASLLGRRTGPRLGHTERPVKPSRNPAGKPRADSGG